MIFILHHILCDRTKKPIRYVSLHEAKKKYFHNYEIDKTLLIFGVSIKQLPQIQLVYFLIYTMCTFFKFQY